MKKNIKLLIESFFDDIEDDDKTWVDNKTTINAIYGMTFNDIESVLDCKDYFAYYFRLKELDNFCDKSTNKFDIYDIYHAVYEGKDNIEFKYSYNNRNRHITIAHKTNPNIVAEITLERYGSYTISIDFSFCTATYIALRTSYKKDNKALDRIDYIIESQLCLNNRVFDEWKKRVDILHNMEPLNISYDIKSIYEQLSSTSRGIKSLCMLIMRYIKKNKLSEDDAICLMSLFCTENNRDILNDSGVLHHSLRTLIYGYDFMVNWIHDWFLKHIDKLEEMYNDSYILFKIVKSMK